MDTESSSLPYAVACRKLVFGGGDTGSLFIDVVGEAVVTEGMDLEEMYWAIKSDSSRKFISSSYVPTIVPASGSHLQSLRRSTAEGVKHLLEMSP